jgi:hypothetical protein
MKQLMDLPAEVLVQIMRECPDIKSILRLSATCRVAQAVWHHSTILIICAIFELTRPELMGFLKLAKLEASTSALRQRRNVSAQEPDLHAAVRHCVPWIERSAFAIHFICLAYLTDWINRCACHTRDPNSLKVRIAICHTLSVMWNTSDFVQAVLMLRRFVVGYNYPSTLSAAYITLRKLSSGEVQQLIENTSFIGYECSPYMDAIGIERWAERPQLQFAVPSPLPIPSKFATAILEAESVWRSYSLASDINEEIVQAQYDELCDTFGRDVIRATFGDVNQIPWTEERRQAYDEYGVRH